MINTPDWLSPPRNPALEPGEVHLWLTALDAGRPVVARCAQLLAPDEVARASRFHFEEDRNRYVIGRGSLRTILGAYLDLDPKEIPLHYGVHGKPELYALNGPQFNLAHSYGLALFAFTSTSAIGVDIECIRGDVAGTLIADQFFAPGECEALRNLPESEQVAAFFRCWTRKEAFVKANGLGLSFDLDEFEVSLGPSEPAALLSVRGDTSEAFRWSLHSLQPKEGYIAALAVDGRPEVFRCFSFGGDLDSLF
jgi:4'-phosphopantetheinyl transferase